MKQRNSGGLSHRSVELDDGMCIRATISPDPTSLIMLTLRDGPMRVELFLSREQAREVAEMLTLDLPAMVLSA